MRDRIVDVQPEIPTIGQVHANLFGGATHTVDSIQTVDKSHLEQSYRIDTRSSHLTVKGFDDLVDEHHWDHFLNFA